MRRHWALAVGLVLTVAACEDTTGPDGPDPVPDVPELVFGATSSKPDRNGMFRVQVDGSGLERITELVPRALDVAPDGNRVARSPVGDRVAFSSAWFDGGGEVVVGTLDEEGRRLATRRRVQDRRARALDWRPDGTELVGVGPVDANGNGGVVRMQPDGSTSLSLTPTHLGAIGSSVSYSPDGSRIAYVQDGRIRIIDADGGNMVEVPRDDDMWISAVDWLHTGSPGGDR